MSKLLNKKEIKRAIILLGGIIINSFVDILGLAVVIPVIGLVIDPSAIKTNSILAKTYETLHPVGINTETEFLILLCFVMTSAFLFKAVFGLFINLLQARFSFSVAHRLSGVMWSYHFSKSLERLRSTESGKILTEINIWPITFGRTFIVGGLLLINEFIVVSIIAIGLAFYNPYIFLAIAGILTGGSLIIRKLTKVRLSSYSNELKVVNPRTNTLITNAIRGFIELITFHAVSIVKKTFLNEMKKILRIQGNITVINLAPNKLYEVLTVAALSGTIIISLLFNEQGSGFFELLTLLALSAYRVMPSMSRLNASFMAMQADLYALSTMEVGSEIDEEELELITAKSIISNPKLDVKLINLELGYESLKHPVLSNLNHTFSPGKLHAIVGASGCGKSTLVTAILGIHKPSNGEITIGDGIPKNQWLTYTGYISQQPFLFNGTVEDNLTLRVPGNTLDLERVDSLIKRLKLEECLGSQPLKFYLQEGGANLSGGQQQRLAILRALQISRPILILDEATSALDYEMRDVVIELLKERAEKGITIIIVTHDVEFAAKCDTVLDLQALKTAS